jgi:Tol biopolymer transport system component
VLAYLPGSLWTTKRRIVRVSRDGVATPLDVEPAAWLSVAMSPDGRSLALTEFSSGRTDVRIRDLERGVETGLPLDAVNNWPVWSPDGKEIVFTTAAEGPFDVYRWRVDGSAPPAPLVHDTPDQIPMAWSPNGRYLLWEQGYTSIRGMDLDDGGNRDIDLGPGSGRGAAFSPDSRWVAYQAGVSGRPEIQVRRFPDGTRDYRVSTDGGTNPLWSRDGREILYRRGREVWSASVRAAVDDFVADRPRELFRGDYVTGSDPQTWSYDASTDSLIMIEGGEHEISRDRFVVVLDWAAELAERVK